MAGIWQWLSDNSEPIGAIASILTLVVWVSYFQLLYISYRHRMRAKILISRGGDPSLDARCILANMSVEPVYLEAVIVDANTSDRDVFCSLSSLVAGDVDPADPRRQLLQGPLESGEMIDAGTFRTLLKLADVEVPPEGPEKPIDFKITVLGEYTGDDAIVAVERKFRLEGKRLSSPMLAAQRVRSLKTRRQFEDMLVKADQ